MASSSSSKPNLSITTAPFKHATHNIAFLHAQREWLQLGITVFADLSADSTVGTFTQSASLAQSKEVYVVVVYAVLFNGDGKVGRLRDGKGEGKKRAGGLVCAADDADVGGRRGWRGVEVPSVVLEVQRGDEKSKMKLKQAVMSSFGLQVGNGASKYGVIGTEDSVSLIKAILPVIKSPTVALIVRIVVIMVDGVGAEGVIE